MNLTSKKSGALPSNRSFGWFFTSVFTAFGAYAYWNSWNNIAVGCLAAAALFAIFTLIAQQLLGPLNHLWYGMGLPLGKIVSPIVLGIIFFLLITPISLVTRLFGRDELRINKRSVDSYWKDRSPPGPPSDSFKNQY